MKAVDYINTLIKERDEIKEICKSHIETIRLMKREIMKLNNTISKQEKRIQKLESESVNIKTKNELDNVKSDLKKMKTDYKDLQNNYNAVVAENEELKRIFDEIEKSCDSD